MENDWRLKQLMNTYTEMSGRTHVCSGQLLSELGRGTSEGVVQVHRLSSGMDKKFSSILDQHEALQHVLIVCRQPRCDHSIYLEIVCLFVCF